MDQLDAIFCENDIIIFIISLEQIKNIMAIYRLSLKSISRSNGRSAIAAACYRSGDTLDCKVTGDKFNYSKKRGIYHSEILIPEGADKKFLDRKTLWDSVEDAEVYKVTKKHRGYERGDYIPNAELAKELQLALPTTLDKELSVKLVKDFCEEHFTSRGLACDIAFHDMDSHNPHCHIMSTTRMIDGDSLGEKNRELVSRDFLIDLRLDWENVVNKEFLRQGIDERITAASYRDRGIDITGVSAKFNDYDRDYVLEIREKNTQNILNDIDACIGALTDKKAVVSMSEIDSFLKRNVTEDRIVEVKNKLMLCENIVPLKNNVFTSFSYFRSEINLLENINNLNNNVDNLNKAVDWEYASTVAKNNTLREEQKAAFIYALSNDSNIKNIRGFAGAGKSWTIAAIVDVYKQSGMDVKGAALSGVVAEALAKDCGINDSSTVASLLLRYEKGMLDINEKTVLIIDEASMIGTVDYEKITRIIAEKGAKLINVGDEAQLKAINAGGANRTIIENSSCISLEEVARQKDALDAAATVQLSTGKQRAALEHYKSKNSIFEHKDEKGLISDVVGTYLTQTMNKDAKTGKAETAIVMAYQKSTVDKVNKIIQEKMLENGKLNATESFVKDGEVFYTGDRFIFLENSKDVGVMNGTIGSIHAIKDNSVIVELDDDAKTLISFDKNKYDKFSLAYASTIHKMQGATLTNAQLIMDNQADSSLALVGCSRHKQDFKLHYQKQAEDNPSGIKDFDHLVKVTEKTSKKDLVSDKNKLILEAYKKLNPAIVEKLSKELDLAKTIEYTKKQEAILSAEKKKLKEETDWENKKEAILSAAMRILGADSGYKNNIENIIEKDTILIAEKKIIKDNKVYENNIKNIIEKDTILSAEKKKLKDNAILINKVIMLDQKAKQAYIEYREYMRNPEKFDHLTNSQKWTRSVSGDISDDRYKERNILLKSFNANKSGFSKEVLASDKYKQIEKMNQLQVEYEKSMRAIYRKDFEQEIQSEKGYERYEKKGICD